MDDTTKSEVETRPAENGARNILNGLRSKFAPDVVALLLLIILALPLIGKGLPLSPIDEHVHLDYALKAGQLQLPADNELLSQQTMRIMACTRMDSPAYVSPCDLEEFLPEVFPDYGYNTASEAHPTYYLATGLVARAFRIFTPVDDLLFSVRLANWLWTAGAGALLFAFLRRRSCPMPVAGSLAALLVLNPVVLASGTHISPDSILPLAGLILYALARRDTARPRDLGAIGASTAILVTIDGAMGLALVMVGAVVAAQLATNVAVLRSTHPAKQRESLLSPILRLAVLGFGALAGPILIDKLRLWYSGSLGTRLTALPRDEWFPRPPFSLDMVLGGFWGSFPPVVGGYLVAPLRGIEYAFLAELIGVLVIGGVGAYLFTSRSAAEQAEAAMVMVVGVMSFPILTVLLWSRGGSFWTLSPRFALAPLAIYALLTGIAARNRASQILIALLAITTTTVYLSGVLSFQAA